MADRLYSIRKYHFPLWGGLGIWVVLAPFPPALHRGEEGLYAGVGGVGVQFLGGVPAHQMLGFQPDAFAPHRSPKGDEGLGVELPTLMGQFVQLFAGADLHAAYPLPTHVHLFFIPALKPVISPVKMQGLKPLYASPLPFCMARLAAG